MTSRKLTDKAKEFVERIGGQSGELVTEIFKQLGPIDQNQRKSQFSTLKLTLERDRQRKAGSRKAADERAEIDRRIRDILAKTESKGRKNDAVASDVVAQLKRDRECATDAAMANLLARCQRRALSGISRRVGVILSGKTNQTGDS